MNPTGAGRFAPRRDIGRVHVWILIAIALAVSLTIGVLQISQQGLLPRSDALRDVSDARPPAGAATDPAWNNLSETERRTLAPLKAIWSTIGAGQRQTWQIVAARVKGKSPRVQRHLQARMVDWARLTPQQRAHARLGFVQSAGRFDAKRRNEQWQAYQSLGPKLRPAAHAKASARPAARGLALAEPGATTILLTQLYRPHGSGSSVEPDPDSPVLKSVDADRPEPTVPTHVASDAVASTTNSDPAAAAVRP